MIRRGWQRVGRIEAAQDAAGDRAWSMPKPHFALIDAAALIALFVASVAVRAPYLQLIPRYTDEVRRVIWSLRILEGGFWPLVYKNGYNGALMIYLDAAALAVHLDPATPRWVAALVASLAPPALYMLGRELHSRLAGAVAGALLSTSFVPVVVFGHLPWAITLAATLVVFGLWLVVRAERRRSARSLLLGAAILGLAVQTHPLSVIILPGVGLWLTVSSRRVGWPGRRLIAAGLAVGALAIAPLILHHALVIARDGRIEFTSTSDLRDEGLVLANYPEGARALGISLVDVLAAQEHHEDRPRRRDPFAWLVVVLAILALGLTAWRGPRLAAFATVSGLAILPLLVQTYNFPLSMRYTGLLLPTIYLAVGCALAAAWQRPRQRTLMAATGVTLAGLVAFVTLVPLARINLYYAQEVSRGGTNQTILALVEATRERWSAQGSNRPAVIMDDEIDAKYPASGNISRALEMLLGLHGVPIDKASTPEQLDESLSESIGPRLVISSDAMRAAAGMGGALVGVADAYVPPGGDGDGFGLYEWRGPATGDSVP